ncbi:Neuronal cell adhesion molecule [Holothuria leucospilota]|uniref:Neuronal cell adhesion molecule n=1 Tax=Holothuria leucospilota TaxID=206669 RepID=A0A9Q1HHF2_HOLLE|nr:Neuronal cell adhesion molecule [Holothuria leucospilota]
MLGPNAINFRLVLIFSVTATLGLCVPQLFQDGGDLKISENPVYPFIYYEHDIYSISTIKEVLSETGHVLLIIPTEPALEISLQASRFAEQFDMRMYTKDMRPFVEQSSVQNCFFHGKVNHQKSSFAVIDACQTPRLKGYISYNKKVYLLEPQDEEEGDGHVIQMQTPPSSLRNLFSSNAILNPDHREEDIVLHSQTRLRRQLHQESRPLFLELYVVCDFALYERFNRDVDALRENVRMVVEVLKELYLDLGIHIVLSGFEVWNERNLIRPMNSGLRTMLGDFLIWREEHLLPRAPHDFAMFISGKGYSMQSSSSPMGFRGRMCQPEYSGLAIMEVNLDDPVLPSLLARFIGFALEANATACDCNELSGCIMDGSHSGAQSPATKFSSCFKQLLNTAVSNGGLSCLLNQPDGFEFPPRCGDGNLDEGEECDCGSEESCTDVCCDPLTCTHYQNSPACQPTTESSPTSQSHLSASAPESGTTSSPEFETMYVEDIITELETEGYSFTASGEEDAKVTTPAYSTTFQPAVTEVPLTEDEKLITQIKDILGDENIQAPPSFIQGPGEGTIYSREGTNVTLTCRVSGLPTPSVIWYKDDDQLDLLQLDQKWTMEEDGSLHITSVEETDEGDYHCEANNTHGIIISNRIRLSRAYLGELPFSGLLEIYDLKERQYIVLRCQKPESSPNPDFYWTKDVRSREPVILSDRVSQTPTGDLVIGSALPEDSGDYSCVITNKLINEVRIAPAIIIKVKALVHQPLWEYTSPSEVTGMKGNPLSLHCIPTGSPTPKVTWEKLGSSGDLEGIELSEGDRTMTILDPDVPHGGEYVCRASNGIGEDKEAIFSVTIEASPEWTSKPEDVEIPAGSTHSFICEARGIPTPSISWLVNGQEAEQAVEQYPHLSFSSGLGSGVFNVTDNEDLYLTVVLQCIAANQHGSIIANAYANIVAFPARIITPPPETVTILEGEDITIPCQALGAPKPLVFWHVGEKMLNAEEDGSLLIPAAGVGDSNRYSCGATNKYGNEYRGVDVEVKGLTRVTISSNNDLVEEGSEVSLTCQVDHHADEPPGIVWSRSDGVPLDGERITFIVNHEISTYKLVIENSVVEDSGFFVCTATTDYDEAASELDITVTEKIVIQPPEAPRNITVSSELPLGLLIEWEREYSLVAPVSMFLVEARTNYYPDTWEVLKALSGEEDGTVIKVSPYVTYWFRIVAKNEVGQAASQRTRPYAIPSSKPLRNPQNVAVDASDPSQIRVSWDEMDVLDHAGPKFYYLVKWRGLGTKRWKDAKIKDHTVTEYVFEMDSSGLPGLEVAVKSGNAIGNGPKARFVTGLFVEPTTVAPLTFSEVPPEFASIMEGSRYKLNCSASGGLNPEIFWYKDGILLASDNSSYTIGGDGGLLFPRFGERDVAVYDCTIRSSTGQTIEARSSLSIRRRTQVFVDPPVVEVTELSSVEVSCEVELDENIFLVDILWVDPQNRRVPYFYEVGADERVYRNNSDLIIEGALLADAGTYTCMAETRLDYAEGSVTITVLELQPPQVSPQSLVVQIQDATTLAVSWRSVSTEEAGGPVEGYHAVARVRGNVEGGIKQCFPDVPTCLLENLTPSETYEVFVAVRTAAGQGPYTSAIYVTLPDLEPAVPPGPVTIQKTRVWAKTLTVKWKGPKDEEPLEGYYLSYGQVGSQDVKELMLPADTFHRKISGLTPQTRYTISIEAFNEAGRSQKVTKLVTTRQKSR